MKPLSFLIAACTLWLAGCASTATLDQTQTSNTYTNKLRLKTAVYIPSALSNREIQVSPSTNNCSMWHAKINSGNGYRSAIESGLSSAVISTDVVDFVPSPELAKSGNYDLLVTVSLSNENASVSVNNGFLSNTINSQFQVSFSLTFADRNGQSLYAYTANGSGFANVNGSCGDIADAAKQSMQTALKQVADYISQSTYGSAQLSDYAKHPVSSH